MSRLYLLGCMLALHYPFFQLARLSQLVLGRLDGSAAPLLVPPPVLEATTRLLLHLFHQNIVLFLS